MTNQASPSPITKKPKLRHYFEYVGFRLVSALLSFLGIERASSCMGWLWEKIAPKTERHTRALRHMNWAMPDKSDQERQDTALKMWNHLGRTFAEGLISHKFLTELERVEYSDSDLSKWSQASEQGSVIISLHQGNWELSVAPAHHLEVANLAGVYRPLSNPLVDGYVRKQRNVIFPAGLFSSKGGAAVAILKHLKSGGHIGILGDLRDRRNPPVSFFGMQAYLPAFPVAAALKLKKPLFIGRTVRTNGANFKGNLEFIEPVTTGTFDENVYATHSKVVQKFEEWVRQDPEQFMWAHNRWTGTRETKLNQKPPNF